MDTVNKLLAGFRRFRAGYFEANRETYQRLAHGQQPHALIVSCCDARVDPAIITDSDPGDLFIVRNVANIVPPFEEAGAYHGTSAALEFGVCNLGVPHVIVLGHARCGGIRSLMEGASGCSGGTFIGAWVKIAAPARAKVLKELAGAPPAVQTRACEMEAILVSLANLMTFPWVRERVENGQLRLHGWYYDIEAGELSVYAPESGAFVAQ